MLDTKVRTVIFYNWPFTNILLCSSNGNKIIALKQTLYFLFFSLSILFAVDANAQGGGCGCTNCPQFMPDNFRGDFLINVMGATNNDLADPAQGVCEVRLTFDHQYIGDLAILLTSPSGQTITLVGPIGLFGESDLSTWDVSFIPCSDTPVPDGGPGIWNNNNVTIQGFDFTGSYHPNQGCLEDFDMGDVNGTWILEVIDGQPVDVGTFIDYEIIFCEDDGINCNSNPCGVFANAEAPSFACMGDTVVIDASGSNGNTFVWGTDDGNFAGTPSGPIVEITSSGTYFVTVSDNGACPDVATIIFNTVPEVPTADITLSGVLDCNNPEITLQGSTDQEENVFVTWVAGAEVDPDNFNPLGMELDLDIDEPGIYTLVIINTESACSQTATIEVEDESVLPVISAVATDTISCTNDTISITGESDLDDSVFEWTGPDGFNSSEATPEIINGGVYSLTVTAPNGCVDSLELTIETDTIPPDFSISSTNELDCTETSSTLSVSTQDSLGLLSWTGPGGFSSNENNPEITQGGIYTLVASSENGCTSESTIEVMQTADVPDIDIVEDGTIDCNNPAYELLGFSTTPGTTFEWTGPNGFNSDQANPGMVTDTGTYVFTVTAPNGCSIMNALFISADTLRPTLSLTAPEVLGCDNMTTTLLGAPTDTSFTYIWSGPNGQTFIDAEPTVEGPGNYDLIVTGENGCTNSFSIEVLIDDTAPALDVSVNPTDILTCNVSEISLINTSDPSNDYTWTGPNGFSSFDLEPLVNEAGTYTVIVTGPNGCTSMDMVQVAIDTLSPDINFTSAELTCSESVVSIGVSSSANIIDYAWTGVGGYTSTEQNPSDITEGGMYTAVITAENGCTNSVTFDVAASIDMPDGEIAAADGNALSCALTELTLNAEGVTPGSTLTWLDPNGNALSTETEIMADETGLYSLIITGPNGCPRTVDFMINEDMDGPEVIDNPSVDLLCLGDVSLSVSSNENIVSYAWTGPNDFSSNNPNPIVDADGSYTVVLTGDNGCTSTTLVEVVDRQEMPSIFVDPTQTLVCGVDQLTINGSSNEPNVMYTWTTPNGSIVGDINNSSLDLNSQGTYVLTITNLDNGCEASAEVIVEQDNNTPTADIVAVESLTLDCNVESITLDAAGSDNGAGFSFAWGNAGGTPIDAETNLQTTITEQGTYFITVTNDMNQCTSIASVTIDRDVEVPALELSPLEELNCNVTTLGIENIAANSVNTLQYDWSTVNGGNITSPTDMSSIEVDMPGSYAVVLTNPDNGCTNEIPFEVTQNIQTPEVSAGQNATLDCGVISILLGGSLNSNETNIDISWTSDNGNIINGGDTFNPEVNAAGTYTLTVINNENGCSNESQVTIEPNLDLPVIEFANTNDFTCGTTSIVLDAGASTSGPGINYSWTSTTGANIFGADGPNPEIFEPGEYILTISNTNNNCESTNTITIGADTLSPMVIVDVADNLSCTVNEVELSILSDISNLNIEWTALTGNILSGENTATPSIDQAGNYEVVVTSTENQCTASAVVEVNLDDNTPTVDIAVPEELNCIQTQITLDAGLSSQGSNISILWENENGNFVSGENGLNPVVDMPGMYTLNIIDSDNGCEVSQSVVVTENTVLPEVNIDSPSMLNCNTLSTTIQAINMGGSTYEYEWQTTDGNILNGASTLNPEIDEEGNYQLTATDTENGCVTTFDIMVQQDIIPPTVIVGDALNLTCENPIALASGLGSSEGTEFIYTWTDANNMEIASTLETSFDIAGTYILEILNTSNGCSETATLLVDDLKQTPEVVVATPETITCDVPTISLSAQDMNNENLEYTWMDENGNVVNNSTADFEIDVDLSGPYSVLIVNPLNGCDTIISVFVDANTTEPVVDVSASNAGEISCDNPTVMLTGTIAGLNQNEVSFVWQTLGGNIVSGENTLTPIVNVQGTYQLMVIDLNNGCSNLSEVNITQDDSVPLASLNEPQELNCEVLETTLTFPDNGGNIDIVWALNGSPIPNANTNELLVTTPGDYSVLITNLDNGCENMDFVTVIQDIVQPVIDAGADFQLQCNIPEFQIQGTSDGNPNNNIIWNVGTGNITEGENTLTPTVNSAGIYTLTVTNEENACSSTDEVVITRNNNIPFDLLVDELNPQCEDDLGSINIIEVLGGEAPFMYSIDGGATFSDETQFEDLDAGDYQIAILDSNECPFVQNVTIDSAPAIGVDLPVEIELLLGDTATLNANLSNIDVNDIQSIQWIPSTGLSCDDCLNPTVLTTSGDINYELEIVLGSGCSASDEIQLRVDRNLDVYVPDAFSPYNLDGINDEFFLFARDRALTNIRTFAIFDRWGNQVFLRENIQPNDPSVGWKGEFRDEPYNPGVFVYFIEVEFRTGDVEIIKGNVTVMD